MTVFKRIIFITIMSFYSNSSFAIDFYGDVRKKQQAKEAKRWSLGQWLEQKKGIQLMDMWLMYNAPDPYEFFLGADTSSFDQISEVAGVSTSTPYRNYRGHLGAFVSIVGLYGEYESSDEELSQWKALFMLRLLGSSDQSTNLTLHYGLFNRKFNTNDSIQHQMGGGRISLYILKPFALTGQYDHILEATSEMGIQAKGSRIEGGAHIEYGAFRFYGTWFEEKMDIISTGVESKQDRTGILFGARLYF